MIQQSEGNSRKWRKQKSSRKRANQRRREKHERGQKRKIGREIGMIDATDETVHLDQISRMIGTGVIVDTLRVAIRIGMTTGLEVGHAARLPGGRGITDVATIVRGEDEMIVATDIIEVNGSRRNTMTAYPHQETTIDPAMIDHHRRGNTNGTLTIITKPNQTSPAHQQRTWPPVPPPLALHLHLARLHKVVTQWTNNVQLD